MADSDDDFTHSERHSEILRRIIEAAHRVRSHNKRNPDEDPLIPREHHQRRHRQR